MCSCKTHESRNALDGLRKLQGKKLCEEAQGRILEEQISNKLYEQKVVLEIVKIKAQWLKAEAKSIEGILNRIHK